MVAAQLERAFADRYDLLVFRRRRHDKSRQGRASLGNLLFGIWYVGRCCARLLVRRPQVLYIDVPKDAPSFLRSSVVLLAARILRVRVVGDLAGADFPFLRRRSPLASYARWLLAGLYRLRVLGESVSAALNERGLVNTVVIPNGIDDPALADVKEPAAAYPQDETRLLYVGKIAVAKGADALVGLLQQARAEGLDARLDVLGEWESEETRTRVSAAVVAAGVADRIAFHGLVTDRPKWAAYRRAHVLVHPTRWDGQPLTILEAYAMSRPVVATRVGAIPDTVDHGVDGVLVDSDHPEDLLGGIRYLLRDPESYARACAAARRAYETRYSAEVFAASIGELFERAVADRR